MSLSLKNGELSPLAVAGQLSALVDVIATMLGVAGTGGSEDRG
jgi:hypothetical protein